MNILKRRSIFSLILCLAVVSTSLSAYGQDEKQVISKSNKITGNCESYFDTQGMPLHINSWNKDEIKLDYSFQIDAKDANEIKEFLAEFSEKLEKQLKEAINGRVKATVNLNINSKNGEKSEVKIEGNSRTFKFKSFKVDLSAYLPRNNQLYVRANFNDVSIGDFTNSVHIDINSGDFDIKSCKILEARMNFCSDSKVGEVSAANVNANSSTLNITSIKNNLNLNCNFSSITASSIGDVANLEMNSSSFVSGDLMSLNINGNFVRKCEVGNVNTVNLEMNSSHFSANSIQSLRISGLNFSKLKMNEVGAMEIASASSSEVKIEKAGSIKAKELSFCDFNLGSLSKSLVLSASSGDVNVENVLEGFEMIDISGSFVTTNIKLSPAAGYSLHANLTFPDYNFGSLPLKVQNLNLNTEIVSGSKGSDKSKIKLDCQSCKLTVK